MTKIKPIIIKNLLIQLTIWCLLLNIQLVASDSSEDMTPRSPTNIIIRSPSYEDISQFSPQSHRLYDDSDRDKDEATITPIKFMKRQIEDCCDDTNILHLHYVTNYKLDLSKIIVQITTHPNLHILELVGCNLDDQNDTKQFHCELIEWLKNNNTLEILDLSDNPLNMVAFDYIAALQYNKSLRVLRLKNTVVDACQAPKAVLTAIKEHEKLRYLSLKKNQITNCDLFVIALSYNKYLLKFNMNYNRFLNKRSDCLLQILIAKNQDMYMEQVKLAYDDFINHCRKMNDFHGQVYYKLEFYAWQQMIGAVQ